MSELRGQLEGFRSPSSVLDGDAVPAPTPDELARAVVAPGSDALLPVGIVYQAGWEPAADGIARHARLAARALGAMGLPVALRSLPIKRMELDSELDPAVLAEVDHLRKASIGTARLAIRQVIIHSPQFLESVVAPFGARLAGFGNELAVYRSTIVYTSWERTTVHPEIVDILNRCARVWVPCHMNREVFERAGVKHVDVIPCPFDPNDSRTIVQKEKDPSTGKVTTTIREVRSPAFISAPRGSESVPDGRRFYAIGKWEPRKNCHALLGAFLSEFRPTEHASLLIKTSDWGAWQNYPTIAESVAFWLEAVGKERGWTRENFRRRVAIITKQLPEEELMGLHKKNNIYVTCSHGEAWDLPAFDARLAGNRLVYTGWGGADDYAGEYDVRIASQAKAAELKFEPVHSGYGWEADAMWASCEVAEIRKALRRAEPPRARVLPPELVQYFGLHVVGRAMDASIRKAISFVSYQVLVEAGGFG